jgi:hypothetical protein
LNAAFLTNEMIFTLDLFVFALTEVRDLAFLQSSIHEAWTRRQASTHETRLRYTATDCYETLPRPSTDMRSLDQLGFQYDQLRQALTAQEGIGLTKLYNLFHDPAARLGELEQLRRLHANIDIAVAREYGWNDLDLGHAFHEVPYLSENDRVRFTISEAARGEVLRRLAELNRSRYAAEVRAGLHGSTEDGLVDLQSERRRRAGSSRTSVKADGASFAQGDFALEESPRKVAESSASYESANVTARKIREWLATHRGWHAKEDILAGTRLDADRWSSAIKELVETGAAAKQGERRRTRYRAI